ncbi:MAG: hypothetical protein U0R49_01270 [Fimbriimonadales bacterium]
MNIGNRLIASIFLLGGSITQNGQAGCNYSGLCPDQSCDSGCSPWDAAGTGYRCQYQGGWCCDCSGTYYYCKTPTSPFYCSTLYIHWQNKGEHPFWWVCTAGFEGDETHCAVQ